MVEPAEAVLDWHPVRRIASINFLATVWLQSCETAILCALLRWVVCLSSHCVSESVAHRQNLTALAFMQTTNVL